MIQSHVFKFCFNFPNARCRTTPFACHLHDGKERVKSLHQNHEQLLPDQIIVDRRLLLTAFSIIPPLLLGWVNGCVSGCVSGCPGDWGHGVTGCDLRDHDQCAAAKLLIPVPISFNYEGQIQY